VTAGYLDVLLLSDLCPGFMEKAKENMELINDSTGTDQQAGRN